MLLPPGVVGIDEYAVVKKTDLLQWNHLIIENVRADWSLFGYSPKRATMMSCFYYVFLPLDLITHHILPSCDASLYTLEQFIFTYCISEILNEKLHRGAYLWAVPLTMWISGVYEIKITSYGSANGVISVISMMMFCAFLDARKDYFVFIMMCWLMAHGFWSYFIQTTIIGRMVVAIVTLSSFAQNLIYTLQNGAKQLFVGLYLFVVALNLVISMMVFFSNLYGMYSFAEEFRVIFEDSTLLQMASCYLIVWGGQFGEGARETSDNRLLRWIRKPTAVVSMVVFTASVNTVLYFTFGMRIYWWVISTLR